MSSDSKQTLLTATALSIAGATASYLAAGATLGLFIGGLGFAGLIAPPFALALSQRLDRLLLAIAVAIGNVVVWIFAFPAVDSLLGALVYLAFTLAIIAVAHASRSAAIATVIALGWLSLPIWLRTAFAASLVGVHPMFAINGVNKSLGIWTQQPIMYRLTTLGQDVPYALPASIWPCVILHGAIGLLLLIPAKIRARAGDEPSDPQTRPTPPPAPPAPHTP
ncbi:hypothetical protein BH09PLA1_BH09PLA1_02830 [soil metagenome]